MSEKAQAAQQWAEAKSALELAEAALTSAKEAYAKAEDAEFHAWQALESLAGRTAVKPEVVELKAEDEVLYVSGGPNQPTRRHAYPGDITQKPVG